RRRHTRFSRDWSSDVCTSDLSRADRSFELGSPPKSAGRLSQLRRRRSRDTAKSPVSHSNRVLDGWFAIGPCTEQPPAESELPSRSEERRVGRECRSLCAPYEE